MGATISTRFTRSTNTSDTSRPMIEAVEEGR